MLRKKTHKLLLNPSLTSYCNDTGRRNWVDSCQNQFVPAHDAQDANDANDASLLSVGDAVSFNSLFVRFGLIGLPPLAAGTSGSRASSAWVTLETEWKAGSTAWW